MPYTKAGKKLLEIIYGMDPQGLYPPNPVELIDAIEAEMVDVILEAFKDGYSYKFKPTESGLTQQQIDVGDFT